MDSSKKIDILSGVLILIISVVLFISTFGFQQMTESRVGSAFFPQIASVGMAVMSILLIASPFIQKKIKEAGSEMNKGIENDESALREQEASENIEEDGKKHYGKVVLTIVLLISCVVLLEPLGFIISTAMFLFLQMIIMSKTYNRRYITFFIVSILTAVFIYWIFRGFFNLMLPAGLLG